MILTNSVLVAIASVLGLALLRVNVVIALTAGAILGGTLGGFSVPKTLEIFASGLGGGANIALSYGILGAFAAAVAHSGVPIWLSQKVIHFVTSRESHRRLHLKALIFVFIGLIAIASKNILPVHIAFIPILIPPLLEVFAELQIDRRLLSNLLAFGLIFAYMLIPYGFGSIFLDSILRENLLQYGVSVSLKEIVLGMALPAFGMVVGLVLSLYRYRKPRHYDRNKTRSVHATEEEPCTRWDIIVSGLAILGTLIVQIILENTIASAMTGFCIFTLGGVVGWHESDNIVTQGFKMMSLIAFIMIAASGFSAVLQATGDTQALVSWLTEAVHGSPFLGALGMLLVGLLITMGIGSSFSTVPIVAGICVPLCVELGFSPLATVCLIGATAALGDAGSPVSDTMLGVTSGLNADGQHDHIWDSCVPAFIYFNLPVMGFALIGALCL
ncbi:MAG: sodium:proton antiporter [Verrucomicrobiota bacterium]|nr:MAG: sodium:proton antiporter [Verrucomicrobiota bacterium]